MRNETGKIMKWCILLLLLYCVMNIPPAKSYAVSVATNSSVYNLGDPVVISVKILERDYDSIQATIVVRTPEKEVSYLLGYMTEDTRNLTATGITTVYGNYSVIVTAEAISYPPTGNPTISHVEYATTTFSVEPPDFSVSALPLRLSLNQGENSSLDLEVTPIGAFDNPVTLTVSGLPSGASSEVTVQSGKPPFKSRLTISTLASMPEGSYTVALNASGGDKTHALSIQLIVEKKPKLESNTTIAISQDLLGKVTVKGSLIPTVEGTEVILTYYGPQEEQINRNATVLKDGSFTDVYTADLAGKWTVKAVWAGNEEYTASQSEERTFMKTSLIPEFLSGQNILIIIIAVVAIFAVIVVWKQRDKVTKLKALLMSSIRSKPERSDVVLDTKR